MDIRITGTEEECEILANDLKHYYDVISVSTFYPNNRKVKESKEGRIYVKAKLDYIDTIGKVKTI